MAVTVTYEHPVIGTTPPTAAQAQTTRVTATVIATADADTTAVITHNFGLSAGALAAGQPVVVITKILQAPAAVSQWANTSTLNDANTITLTKGTGAGSGNAAAQIRVTCFRPHTIIGATA